MYILESNLVKRTVESDNSVYTQFHLFSHTPPAAPVNTSNPVYLASVDRSSFTGYDVPNFNERRRRGDLIGHTPWRQFICSGSTNSHYDYWTNNGISHNYAAPDENPVFNSWELVQDDLFAYASPPYDSYVAEAAAKIYSSGWDALTFLAEFKQLLHTFANVIKTVREISRNVKGVSNAWLSARYGWRPFIYDLLALDRLIKTWNDKRSRYSEKVGNTTSFQFQDAWETQWTYLNLSHTLVDNVTLSMHGSVTADIEIPKIRVNPLITAWEKVPFSFVIDWVLNVGKTLAAISFLMRERAYSASWSYYVTVDRVYNVTSTPRHSHVTGDGFQQYGTCHAELKVRVPSLIPYHPHFVVKINPQKIIDLIGLVFQRL